MRLNKLQKTAVSALEDIKARDIIVLDTRTLTASWDSLIIATADSARQTKALARNVQDQVKAAGGLVNAIEGEETGEWVLVDCGDLVVHIMQPATRSLYNLEELWTATPPPTKTVKTAKVVAQKNGLIGIKTTSRKPATKKVATKVPTTQPAAKKPVAKKPATKKTASKRGLI